MVGGIINKFKIKRRRVTLFFEDILANYIKECEKKGYKKEMREIGELWSSLNAEILIPSSIKKLPLPLFSQVAKMVWANLGILEDIEIMRKEDMLIVTTKGEAISRIIGKNEFSVGSYSGLLKVFLNSGVKCIKRSQSEESCEYYYRMTKEKADIKGRNKCEYDKYNSIPDINGYTLKDAIKNNILRINKNRIYFRGKSMCNIENTLFHIIGNRKILLEKVPEISYQYFDEIIGKTSNERHLLLLRTLLQVMGWGYVKIIMKSKRSTLIEISHAPRGFQIEPDNYDFLINVISGYLQAKNGNSRIKNISYNQKAMIIEFISPR